MRVPRTVAAYVDRVTAYLEGRLCELAADAVAPADREPIALADAAVYADELVDELTAEAYAEGGNTAYLRLRLALLPWRETMRAAARRTRRRVHH